MMRDIKNKAIELIKSMDKEEFEGCIYWDRDSDLDEEAEDIIYKAMEYKEDISWEGKLYQAMWDCLDDWIIPCICDIENEIIENVIEKISKELEDEEHDAGKIEEYLKDEEDIIYKIEDRIIIDEDFDTLLRHTKPLKINIYVRDENEDDVDEEINYIKYKYLGYEEDYTFNEKIDVENGIIGKLFKSQGYAIEDLKNKEKVDDSVFLSSFVNEVENLYGYAELVFLTGISMEDMGIFCGDKIEIDEFHMCGLFDSMFGRGSVLDIELEKPFVIDAKDWEIDIDTGEGCSSIWDVYGLDSSAWGIA